MLWCLLGPIIDQGVRFLFFLVFWSFLSLPPHMLIHVQVILVFFQDLMRGSKTKAHVLYAPVEEIDDEGRLLRACRIRSLLSFIFCRLP